MKITKFIKYIQLFLFVSGIACIHTGCTVGSRLKRTGQNVLLSYIPNVAKEISAKAEETPLREYRPVKLPDGSERFILPATAANDGKSITTLEVPEVTVVAR